METIIVDDEQRAIDMLEFHLKNYFPDYKITGCYLNIDDAQAGIISQKPDVVFLDINMPSGSGIELLNRIKHLNCVVIFLTAHSEYAIEAIKLDAFDYLLKPISLEEMSRVDAKIKDHFRKQHQMKSQKIKIQISNTVHLFEVDEIIYAKSEGNYTTVYSTIQSPLVLTKNMKKVQNDFFSNSPFFRCHQSFIVNLNHVISYSNYELTLNEGSKVSLSNKNYPKLAKLISLD